MTIHRKIISKLFVVLPVSFLACGEHGAGSVMDADVSGDEDANGGLDGGADHVWPPPMRAACVAPTIEDGNAIPVTDVGSIEGVAVTWSGTESAILYSIDDGAGARSVALVRGDHAGNAAAAPIPVGAPSGVAISSYPVTLTTDGAVHVACWEDADAPGIACAAIPVGGATATPGGTTPGSQPRLASDGVSRLLHARGGVLRIVGTDGSLTTPSGPSPLIGVGRLAARSSGYVLATAYSVGQDNRKVRYQDVASNGTVSPYQLIDIDLFVHALATSGSSAVALVRGTSYAGLWSLVLAPTSTPVAIDTTAQQVDPAFVSATDSFAAVWLSTTGHKYAALSTTGEPQGSAVMLSSIATGYPLALTAVDDGFLLIRVQDGTLVPTHIICP